MYKKTHYTSVNKIFTAREEKKRDNHYHIFGKGESPLFSFDSESNRFVYIGGIAKISPEGMRDVADLGTALYEKDNN